MIQRIQTLYLLMVVLLSAALFYVPVFTDASGAQPSLASNTLYAILSSAIGLLAFISILLFKNRRFQIRLNSLNMLVICIFIATIFYFTGSSSVHYEYGCYFPLAQLIFIVLSNRSIKKDEELVRSADRLR